MPYLSGKNRPKWIVFFSQLVATFIAIALFVSALPVLLFFIFALAFFSYVSLRSLRKEAERSVPKSSSLNQEIVDVIDITPKDNKT